MNQRKTLYPATKSYDSGTIPVSDGHHIYYEQGGNPDGKPAVYVHGGPGGGSGPGQRRVFDPDRYRVVLFDQRGCGRSTPYGSIDHNTTWHLVEDMERLREHLGIDRWQVCGGSWGSTLSMAYAIHYPQRVTELILRGIFTLRQLELDWYYKDGASRIFPDEWQKFIAPIPESERDDPISAYHARLTGDDSKVRIEAARAWSTWEGKYHQPAATAPADRPFR